MQRFITRHKNHITVIVAILIVIGFVGHFGFHQPIIFETALILATVIGILPIAISAYQSLRIKLISIDVLVTIAVIGALLIQNYEESSIVTFLFLFGAYLEQRTLNRTRSAIKELIALSPETALVKQPDGSFIETDIDEVEVQDMLLAKTGAKVPVDGEVVSGQGLINEASITGESVPVEKSKGDSVFAGTILENGTLEIVASSVGEDTMFGKIIELVEEAQDSKSEAERFIDRFAKYYTPIVLLIGFITWVFTQNVELAITILVLGCPGALVIGVPVSNVAGIGNGARNGVLMKGSEVINRLSKSKSIMFDKTGTLTVGSPEVVDVASFGDDIKSAESYLKSIENESSHPLAKAILEYLSDAKLVKVAQTEVVKGFGIKAIVDGKEVIVGNIGLMENEFIEMNEDVIETIERFENEGNSLVLTAVDGELKLIMGIRDQVRPEAALMVEKLRNMGYNNVMLLSGDNQKTVDKVTRKLGLTVGHGNMLPADKSQFVNDMQDEGHIITFVGDGVNDSPSLALADVGIAMGSGTDVAIETSDLVLVNSNLDHLVHAIGLAKKTAINMKQNIFIALVVVVVLMLSLIFSDWMNMTIGMLVHELSILVVIFNGMRLLRYKVRK